MDNIEIENDGVEINRTDFENLVFLKNQLSIASKSLLKEVYSDMDNYINFLDTLVLLTQVDSGFLLMSHDYYDRILDIVDIHRFDSEDLVRKVANDIILYINELKSTAGSAINMKLLQQYKLYQEEMREVSFDSVQDLINSVAYDAVVLLAITQNKLELIDNEDYFMYSVNYILKNFPDYFYEKDIKDRTIAALNIIHNNQGLFHRDKKRFSREISDNIQKIKK